MMQQPDWASLTRKLETRKAALQERAARFPNFRDANNPAVKIRRCLESDGHRAWGPVIYRCTYDDDGEWQQVLEELQSEARKTLESHNGLDLWDSFRLTVFDDRARFLDAGPAVVRENFREWAQTAPEREQPPGVGPGFAARYEFCIMVDKAGLSSIVHPDPDNVLNRFVNVVTKDPAAVRAEFTDNMDPDTRYDGLKINDFNWMRVNYTSALVGSQMSLRNIQVKWFVEYRRPPEVAHF